MVLWASNSIEFIDVLLIDQGFFFWKGKTWVTLMPLNTVAMIAIGAMISSHVMHAG